MKEIEEIKKEVEAVLFAIPEPISVQRIANAIGERPSIIKKIIMMINEEYEKNDKPYRISGIAGGYIIHTLTVYGDIIAEILGKKFMRLSRPSLVTLAIIAYKQPVSKTEIDEIRGVDSSGTLKTLLEAEFIKIVGKGESIGHPFLYGTTKKFLQAFHLKSIEDLPQIENENSALFSPGRDNFQTEG